MVRSARSQRVRQLHRAQQLLCLSPLVHRVATAVARGSALTHSPCRCAHRRRRCLGAALVSSRGMAHAPREFESPRERWRGAAARERPQTHRLLGPLRPTPVLRVRRRPRQQPRPSEPPGRCSTPPRPPPESPPSPPAPSPPPPSPPLPSLLLPPPLPPLPPFPSTGRRRQRAVAVAAATVAAAAAAAAALSAAGLAATDLTADALTAAAVVRAAAPAPAVAAAALTALPSSPSAVGRRPTVVGWRPRRRLVSGRRRALGRRPIGLPPSPPPLSLSPSLSPPPSPPPLPLLPPPPPTARPSPSTAAINTAATLARVGGIGERQGIGAAAV